MNKFEDMTKEELIAYSRKQRKNDLIRIWINIIGSSILIIILLVGMVMRYGK